MCDSLSKVQRCPPEEQSTATMMGSSLLRYSTTPIEHYNTTALPQYSTATALPHDSTAPAPIFSKGDLLETAYYGTAFLGWCCEKGGYRRQWGNQVVVVSHFPIVPVASLTSSTFPVSPRSPDLSLVFPHRSPLCTAPTHRRLQREE